MAFGYGDLRGLSPLVGVYRQSALLWRGVIQPYRPGDGPHQGVRQSEYSEHTTQEVPEGKTF